MVCLVRETKTTTKDRVPHASWGQSAVVQAATYKYMLDKLRSAEAEWLLQFLRAQGCDVEEALSADTVAHVEASFGPRGDSSRSDDVESGAGNDKDGLAGRKRWSLRDMAAGVVARCARIPRLADVVEVQYESQQTKTVLGVRRALYNGRRVQRILDQAAAFWSGQRAPVPPPDSAYARCERCEYLHACPVSPMRKLFGAPPAPSDV
jgi:hypothetical protein